MPWRSKNKFETIDPETGEKTTAMLKVENGIITDFSLGREQDKSGGYHGHVWKLDKEPEEIGGRDPVDESGNSVYGDDE
jgi:hypothetical protein